MKASVPHVYYAVNMTAEIRNTPTTLRRMPKQTRPPMVGVNFRVPPAIKEAGVERAAREGINLTDALRDYFIAWAKGEDE